MPESPILEEVEAAVVAQSIKEYREVLDGIERILNGYIAGAVSIGRFTQTDDNKKEWVWFLLTTRSFASMRCAFDLLKKGYYTQSVMLIRSTLEDWLAGQDCLTCPSTLAALLDPRARMPHVSEMVDRLDSDLQDWWRGKGKGDEGAYGVLSTFVHPRPRGLGMVINPESSKIRFGTEYDRRAFIFTATHLVTAARRMSELLARIAGKEWLEGSAQSIFVKDAPALQKSLAEEEARLLA